MPAVTGLSSESEPELDYSHVNLGGGHKVTCNKEVGYQLGQIKLLTWPHSHSYPYHYICDARTNAFHFHVMSIVVE